MDLLKDDVFRFVGIFLIGFGIFFDALAVLGATVFSEEVEVPPITYVGVFGICTASFLIPGIILYSMGRKMGKEEMDHEILAAILNTYQKVSITEAASRLGKSEPEIEQLILDCVRMGLVKGIIDRENHEFILEGYNPDGLLDNSTEIEH